MLKKVSLFLFIITFFGLFCFAKENDSFVKQMEIKKYYELYKKNYMSIDGRIIDGQKNNISTSEGQSYMLLRSVMMNDKKTFNLVLKWTINNLQRSDYLLSWLWGENKIGKWEVLDKNSATDADIDTAYALILAYEKWRNEKYLEQAKKIINSIWENETKIVKGKRIIMPGYLQAKSEIIEVNPSYFSPWQLKMFQKYDKYHNWQSVVESSYYYLDEISKQTKNRLFPNWFIIDDGKIIIESSERGDFSYDAIRVFSRCYWDYYKSKDKRALKMLAKSEFFIKKWQNEKLFYTNYKADGTLRDKDIFKGSISVIALAISIFNPNFAEEIFKDKLIPYVNNENYWQDNKKYYGSNLLWFSFYFYKLGLSK